MMKVQNKPEQIKYAPKSAEGYSMPGKLGSGRQIIMGNDKILLNDKRIATALASPGLFGTWPMIDFCRGYAYIVFVKNLLGEERADAHQGLKKMLINKSHLPVNNFHHVRTPQTTACL